MNRPDSALPSSGRRVRRYEDVLPAEGVAIIAAVAALCTGLWPAYGAGSLVLLLVLAAQLWASAAKRMRWIGRPVQHAITILDGAVVFTILLVTFGNLDWRNAGDVLIYSIAFGCGLVLVLAGVSMVRDWLSDRALAARRAQIAAARATTPVGSAVPGRAVLLGAYNVKKYFPIRGGFLRSQIGSVYAVDDVTLEIYRGEKFGLVGESGCGKTTFGRTILRLERATDGLVTMDGQDILALSGWELKATRRRMQVIFQDPYGSLNPRMPVSDIIGEGLLAQADRENGWGTRAVRDKRVGDYLEAVGLRRDYSRRYPHEFSGGQRQRIGIARALALGPEFVVCDEPVSALDVSIQSQILNLLSDLRDEFNLTYLFIAHNLSVVQYFCERIGVMYLGKLVEIADTDSLYEHPRHPYSVALLSAIPVPNPRVRKKRLILKGDVPSPASPPPGCRFHPRCWLRERLGNPEICSTVDPPLRDLGGQMTACHFAEQVSAQAAQEAAARQSVIDTLAGPD